MDPSHQIAPPQSTSIGRERRRSPRFGVRVAAKLTDASGHKTLRVASSWTIDLSIGGVKIEWPCCDDCGGYQDGSIHQLCVLKPYDSRMCNSLELSLCLELPDREVINVHGKISYVQRSPETHLENIGIEFTSFEGDGREQLARVLAETRNVLVVDNSVGTLGEQLAWIISGNGQAALYAPDCDKAIELLDCEEVDLIVAGVDEPDLEGPYVMHTLARVAPLTPVILVIPEGAQPPDDPVDCFAMVSQPFSHEQLEMLIEQSLGGEDGQHDHVNA